MKHGSNENVRGPAGPTGAGPASSGRLVAPSDRPALPTRGAIIAGVIIIFLLCAVCVGLAFQSGAYTPRNWLPSLIGVAALAVVVSVAGPSVPSGRFQKILLGLFAAQAVWTTASILWATSAANAWEETNRTLFYAVAIVLMFAAVRWAGRTGLKVLAVLVTCVVGLMALVIAIRLGASDAPSRFFLAGRLSYPVTYFNALASLMMLGFWLALGMANAVNPTPARALDEPEGGRFPRWTQPLLLALSVFLLELALLPQSRGAFWTFFLVVPFFIILSPNRFRALVDLAIVVLPVVLFWGRITGVYTAASAAETPLGPALDRALGAIGYSILIVVAAWAFTWLVERWFAPLPRRAVKWIGIALIVLTLAGAAGGLIYAHERTGGLGDYLGDRWAEVVSDQQPGSATSSRFVAVGLSGRLMQWKVAAKAFEEEPLLGIGAQNFEAYYYLHRTTTLVVRQPHSQPMQLLAELGLPGLLLWVAFVVLTLVYAVRLRFRPLGRAAQAVIAAMMTAVISWLIHSSADWLWQMAGASLPALMLLGGLVGAGETRAPAASTQKSRHLRATRPLAAFLALLVIVSAALPYLSLRYCDMAAGAKDLEKVTARAHTAAMLDPTSVMPFVVRANAHQLAALQAPEGSPDRVAQFELEATAWVEATGREPGGWLYYYKAAEAFLAARDAALTIDADSAEELAEQARTYLAEARRLNPLSPQVSNLEEDL